MSRASDIERLRDRSAGYTALIARNEQIRRLKRTKTDAEIAAIFEIGVTTVGKIHVGNTGRR